ncbi:MAG: sigma-54-dependent Fis family transcriptional regulator, partial [Burkholderiales bacterium]|nr:sigma-54-dependent Fis family transcriptional regulator [Burkholderiales bacterium]
MTNNTKPGLLIVDDDPQIADTLAQALGNDFEPVLSDSRAQAINLLRQLREPPPLALVDLGLPPVPQRPDEGFRLITELLAHSPHIKILALTDQNDTVHARHARALGAFEFVAKPCEPEQLRKALTQALAFRRAEMSGSMAVEAGVLIGRSPAMQKLRSQISQYADSPFPALIEGESGSGKELVANALHRLSSRKDKPFLALNCAAIEPDQVEPALFGCVQGACPGAQTVRSGYLEDAADGTLFLDEVGELPPELQAKLLRVLENGEYQRMGETQRRYSRARIIAATNRDLRQEIRKGRFRADLYHRLSVFTVTVPPLREMDDDKLLLLEHFRAFYA